MVQKLLTGDGFKNATSPKTVDDVNLYTTLAIHSQLSSLTNGFMLVADIISENAQFKSIKKPKVA